MTAVLTLDDVSVTFGRGRRAVRALGGVSFEIAAGETLGLVGESGSGKSTAGAIALGLRQPDTGTATFCGEPIGRRMRARAGRIAAVLQHPVWSLDPRRSVLSSVVEPLRVTHSSDTANERRHRALSMLNDVGLDEHMADARPHELSGGQRQRVSVARALVTNPAFIVFDEAVSALDVSVQAQILNLIVDLQAAHGFAALFISHDLSAVRYVSHRVGVLRRGELLELAETAVFYSSPSHPYSRTLLEEPSA